MAALTVEALPDGRYRVTVPDAGTEHLVSIPSGMRADPLLGRDPERLVRQSFDFLLEREPATSILREFSLDVIGRYFPEYPEEVRARLEDGSGARVVVTFRAEGELRMALAETLGVHSSPAFLSDLDGASRLEALRSADVVLVWNAGRELSSEELAALSEGPVRLIQLMSAGADHVRFTDFPDSAIVASNVGAYAEPMAEHVVAMALALAKKLPQKHAELARGQFNQRPATRKLAGLVAGILGFGGIGKEAGRLLRPLGMRIQAINTTGRTEEEVDFVGTLGDLDRVLATSDVVVVTLPLTRQTRGLIGRHQLELMKPDAILVNVARGAIIDERALYEHLRDNPEFLAGVDAWWIEPFGHGEFRTDFPFFDLPNLLGSPHNSAIVPGIEAHAARRAAENVVRFLNGAPLRGVAHREEYSG